MKKSQLQVGLDISQKRLDVCAMRPDGEVVLSHHAFANNRKGYAELKESLLRLLEAENLDGLEIAGESTGYYWLPLFLQLTADEAWPGDGPVLFLLNSRQVYWFKKGFAEDDKTDAKDSFYVTEKLRTQRRQHHPWAVDLSWLRLRFYSRLRFAILSKWYVGGVTDFFLSGAFQYAEDLQNPYFRPEQRFARVGIAGLGGFAVGFGGTIIGTSLGCGPYSPICIAGSGVVLGAAWAFGLQPMIFDAVPFLQPPPRNLLPVN